SLHAHHGREPFDGVQAPVHLSHGVGLRPPGHPVQSHQGTPAAPEVVVRFGHETAEELAEIDGVVAHGPLPPPVPASPADATGSSEPPSRDRASSWICSGEKGLVMKRDAPASRARSRDASSPRVVTTRIGSSRSWSCPRTNSSTS